MSFIEAILSIVLLALISVILLAMSSMIRGNMQKTLAYSEMKIYAMNTFDKLQLALEQGYEIDTEDYNDPGTESGIRADVYVSNIGDVHGKYTFLIHIDMCHEETGTVTQSVAILRRGCIAHAP